MSWTFETLGNATIQIARDGKPVLVTDPWLQGSAYFGSWELERPLSDRQRQNAIGSRYVWFSHGHPDHFHPDSVQLLDRTSAILIPDHYEPELARALREWGFSPRILPNKQWVPLEDGLKVLCVANENMDAIVAFEVDGALLLNKNDSPFCGENCFFRNLVAQYETNYLFALCAFDADMINIVDTNQQSVIGPPSERKPGTVFSVGQTARYLGARTFCCSSSQHVYARPDSAWANDYRITWAVMQKLWPADDIRLVPPYSTVEIRSGTLLHTDADEVADPSTRVRPDAGEDWSAKLSEEEWARVDGFARQFETLRRWQDFIAFNVGGETRTVLLSSKAERTRPQKRVGVTFHVPRGSLLETVDYGYFDDLLIGNFMKTELHGMQLYPLFSPRVAKLGGNAKVFTASQLNAFRWHYFRRSPLAFLRYRADIAWNAFIEPAIRRAARRTGLFDALKSLRGRIVGRPRTL